MIDKIHNMVLTDREIKTKEIVEVTGILQSKVFTILRKKLDLIKISALCVGGAAFALRK